METLDFIINLLHLTDSESHIRKNWNILSDKNEYLGEKIKSFLALVLLIIVYAFLIVFIFYIINHLFFK
jgi:hypothetical protein